MLNTNSFILILILICCATNFAASTESRKERRDRAFSEIETFKNVTIEELPPEQLEIIRNFAQELNVALDDVQVFMRLYAEKVPWLRLFFDQGDRYDDILDQFRIEVEEIKLRDPKEISIEYLSKNHPKLVEIANELNATNDEFLFFTRSTLVSADKDHIKRMQNETSICPVPPEEVSENPSSDEFQKYVRLVFSLDLTPNATYASQAVQLVKKVCVIPDSIIRKVLDLLGIWRRLNIPY